VIAFETDQVPGAVRWVKSEPDQDPFPHLYGPIPCAAVRQAVSAASPSGPTDGTARAPASP
jgi:uncharacterized protein (DUF952 family)